MQPLIVDPIFSARVGNSGQPRKSPVQRLTPLSQAEFDEIGAAARAAGGDFRGGAIEEGFVVSYYVQGIKCDFAHGLIELEERRMATMLDTPDLDPINHIILSGLLDAVALYGKDWHEPWQVKLQR
jgi:hypothetical protein